MNETAENTSTVAKIKKLAIKVAAIVITLLVIAGAGAIYIKFYFPFGEGVKAGELNRVVRKGYVFKTYEGYIIQAGFSTKSSSRATKSVAETTNGIQSNEFLFSVKDKEIADSLMYHCGGKMVELHYKEYLGSLPWRGKERYVVDKIVAVHD